MRILKSYSYRLFPDEREQFRNIAIKKTEQKLNTYGILSE